MMDKMGNDQMNTFEYEQLDHLLKLFESKGIEQRINRTTGKFTNCFGSFLTIEDSKSLGEQLWGMWAFGICPLSFRVVSALLSYYKTDYYNPVEVFESMCYMEEYGWKEIKNA